MFKTQFKFALLTIITLGILGCRTLKSVSSSDISRQECETDPQFVFIPPGEFIFGSDRQERDYGYSISAQAIAQTEAEVNQAEQKLRQNGWFDREIEQQTKTLAGFCLSRNLITNQEYQEFIQATNHRTPNITEAEYQQQGFLVHPYAKVQEFLWKEGTYPHNTAQHPVVLISYDDAMAYAAWKSQQTGLTYRLPTAEEWEKAARGTEGQYFPWGNDWSDDATNAGVSKLNYTSAIATFPQSKSKYGVEDMAGNVFEYTSNLISDRNDDVVMMKGCSWDDLPGFCRGAYQHTRPSNSRHILFGFRLVAE